MCVCSITDSIIKLLKTHLQKLNLYPLDYILKWNRKTFFHLANPRLCKTNGHCQIF